MVVFFVVCTCHKSPSYKLYFGTHTQTRTFHFIYIESCTVILYRCAQIEQMYCTSLYTTLHCLHTPVVHTLCLYCCTSSLCTPVLILTNESTTIITRLIRIDQSQLRIWIGSRQRKRKKLQHIEGADKAQLCLRLKNVRTPRSQNPAFQKLLSLEGTV